MGILMNRCPGAIGIHGAPTIKEKKCPECGKTIEVFSSDVQVPCECGFIAYNDALSCVSWCKYARDCVGDEAYERFMTALHEREQAREQEMENMEVSS